MSDLGYVDIRPILAKLSDLDRDLVLVGGQAVIAAAKIAGGQWRQGATLPQP